MPRRKEEASENQQSPSYQTHVTTEAVAYSLSASNETLRYDHVFRRTKRLL
jgi:hypothetical protein